MGCAATSFDADHAVPMDLRWPVGPHCAPAAPPGAAERILSRRAVDLLDVGFDDDVLEVGFGAGLGLALARARGARFVAGVEASEGVVRAAHRQVGHRAVDLRVGAVASLPWADGTFTRALVVNDLHLWDWPLDGLRELRRVLAPGGRLVIGLRCAVPGVESPAPPELPLETVGVLLRMLPTAGFRGAGIERPLDDRPFAYLVAHA
ncbi:MAG: class I SAM-dependent methyltransferase [bacterium]|nr:class I SAM-dependent methyltransferase [bacterium]